MLSCQFLFAVKRDDCIKCCNVDLLSVCSVFLWLFYCWTCLHSEPTLPCLQIGDSADREAQAAEARQEQLLSKEFASKARTTEHRSESHEEVKDGQSHSSSSKSESRQESKNGQTTSSSSKNEERKDGKVVSKSEKRAGEGAGVRDHE